MQSEPVGRSEVDRHLLGQQDVGFHIVGTAAGQTPGDKKNILTHIAKAEGVKKKQSLANQNVLSKPARDQTPSDGLQ